ncbi:MAG: hypothetical protein ACMXYL_00455 [Candidatus Woesearchaeota archaeon]
MAIRILFTLITIALIFALFLGMLSATVDFASKETGKALDGMMEEEQKDTIITMIENMDFTRFFRQH